MKKIRNLKSNEIECRPQSVKNGKVTLLLYIDSRAATDLLDETYGMENWTIEYKDVAGQIYGRLSVYDEKNDRWVYREDTGSPANIEKEKSLASDIIKRCIVRLGVTELYTAPKIIMDDDGYGNSGYKVSHIQYDENRNIISLQIVNKWGKSAFNWEKGTDIPQTPKSASNAPKIAINNNREKLTQFCSQKKAEGVDKEMLKKFYDTYITKVDTWEGKFMVDRLWKYWDKAA